MKITLIISALIYTGVCTSIRPVQDGETTANVESRIIGGSDANIEDYPYQVSVRINDEHVCGGAILDQQWVLTAAHCVSGLQDTAQLTIRTGSSDRNGGVSYSVSNIVEHPDFENDEDGGLPYDVAMLKIASEIVFDETTNAVQLADDVTNLSSRKCTVTGWGATRWLSSTPSDNLQVAEIEVISHAKCTVNLYFTDCVSEKQHICVYESKKIATCGDSGGPLVCQQGGLNLLAGVMSWGSPTYLYTTVCARTDTVRDWIISTMAKFTC